VQSKIINSVVVLTALALTLAGCGQRERARIEIDFSNAGQWRYMLAVDIHGTSQNPDEEDFRGSLRAFLNGMPGEVGVAPLQAGFSDVNLSATFLPEEEQTEIQRRLSDLRVMVSENGVTFSDTFGIPGVLSGGWDIIRSPARVIPAMPNAEMAVGQSWEREQRFPIAIPQGEADGLMYQLYTLDSLFKTPEGVPIAAISWVFTYRVAMQEERSESGERGQRRHPLSGSGRGQAHLDLSRKKLIESKATFQVTYSSIGGAEINEEVHFQLVE
jgi:hypothetical protein